MNGSYWCEERQSPPINNEPSIMQREQFSLCILHKLNWLGSSQTQQKKIIRGSTAGTSIDSSQVARWALSPMLSTWVLGRGMRRSAAIALPLRWLGSSPERFGCESLNLGNWILVFHWWCEWSGGIHCPAADISVSCPRLSRWCLCGQWGETGTPHG